MMGWTELENTWGYRMKAAIEAYLDEHQISSTEFAHIAGLCPRKFRQYINYLVYESKKEAREYGWEKTVCLPPSKKCRYLLQEVLRIENPRDVLKQIGPPDPIKERVTITGYRCDNIGDVLEQMSSLDPEKKTLGHFRDLLKAARNKKHS